MKTGELKMPLPLSLNSAELTFLCPHCGHPFVKSGSWFKVSARFRCSGCKAEVRLTYTGKLALFAEHLRRTTAEKLNAV